MDYELAWAAGFYDGEGCTNLYTNKNTLSVNLTQNDIRSLERFQKAMGGIGTISESRLNATGNSYWRYYAYTKPAIIVLSKLWPYLGEAKKEQALNCLTELTLRLDGRPVGVKGIKR